jgi:hypothetical protein
MQEVPGGASHHGWIPEPRVLLLPTNPILARCRCESVIGVYQQDYRRDGLGPTPFNARLYKEYIVPLDTSPVISTPELSCKGIK